MAKIHVKGFIYIVVHVTRSTDVLESMWIENDWFDFQKMVLSIEWVSRT